MTNEQAITILDALGLTVGMFIQNPDEYKNAIGMGMVALERQIPKNPDEDYEETLDGEYFNGYKCPACKHHIDYGGAYCSWCGQALDWEVKE